MILAMFKTDLLEALGAGRHPYFTWNWFLPVIDSIINDKNRGITYTPEEICQKIFDKGTTFYECLTYEPFNEPPFELRIPTWAKKIQEAVQTHYPKYLV